MPNVAKGKNSTKIPKFHFAKFGKQIALCEHTAREDLDHKLKSKSHLTKPHHMTLVVKGLINNQALPSSHSCSGTLCPVFNVSVFHSFFLSSSVSLFRKICYPIAVTWRRIGAQRGRKLLRLETDSARLITNRE